MLAVEQDKVIEGDWAGEFKFLLNAAIFFLQVIQILKLDDETNAVILVELLKTIDFVIFKQTFKEHFVVRSPFVNG